MIFVIGDLHLSFSTDKPMDKFGSEWKDHHLKIQCDWLSKVSENDVVLLAGDTSWSMRYEDARVDFAWIDKLPGKKVVIKGNHDYWWSFRSRLAAEFNSIFFLNSNHFEYGRFAIVGTRGWDFPNDAASEDARIYRRELVRLENSLGSVKKSRVIIGMVHYPPSLNGEDTEVTRLFEKYGVQRVYYGHLHGSQRFSAAFNGNISGADYRLISCDFTDFKLVKVCDGTAMDVDNTDFDNPAFLLEERLAGIERLSESGDKSKFLDQNFELARFTAEHYINSSEGDIADTEVAYIGVTEYLAEEVGALIGFAADMARQKVRSVADGIIKYNFMNALAKRQMLEAGIFEFSNFEKFLAMRKEAHRIYELKDIIALGFCRALINEGFHIIYYRIRMRSEALNGRLYEIVSDSGEKIILHTTNREIVDFLGSCGIPESEMRNSEISGYVNKRFL